MSPLQVGLVQESWKLVVPIADEAAHLYAKPLLGGLIREASQLLAVRRLRSSLKPLSSVVSMAKTGL